jgi:macrolide transport system ATP-binding/permease protein
MRLLASLFRRSHANQELDEELRSHIQHRADDLEAAGIPRMDAERRARVEFGGYTHYKQESHTAFSGQFGQFSETLWQDVRIAFRTLRKAPGFTVVAALTLALSIGANSVVFSVLNGLVLRPINVPQAKDLAMIERGRDPAPMQSYPDYLDLRDRNHSFDGMVAYEISPAGLDTGSKPTPVWVWEASGNYFDVLGVQPYLGRFFHASDEHGPNSAPYIVLTYAFWQSHFQSDAEAVGRVVQLNRHPYTILGVAKPEFRGTELFMAPAFWVPLVDTEQVEGASNLTARGTRGMSLLGRLKPGVTPAQAAADLNSVGKYLEKAYPKDDGESIFTLTRPGLAGDMLGRPVRAFMTGLMLLAGLILLAACANLGSLFAARAADRSREVALRLALGSSRQRILRQLLTEALLISILGGIAGMLGGVALLRWLSMWSPSPDFPLSLPVNPDALVYCVSLLLALASGLIFGLVPVRQVLRSDPYQIVKMGSADATGRRFTPRDILLVVQIAVCAVLVTSSLVAVRGLVRTLKSNFGFDPQNAMLVDTDLDMAGYSGDRIAPMQQRLLDAMEDIPGVTAVGLNDRVPLTLGWSSSTVFADSTTDLRPSNAIAEALFYNTSPGYLQAAGTTLVAGRIFTTHDDAHSPRVAIANREFARKVLGARNGSEAEVVGRYYKIASGTRIQVVGIVEDGRYRTLTEDPQPAIFLPVLQWPTSATWLVLRSTRDPQQLREAIEAKLRELDPGLPFTIRTWNRELDIALFPSRMAAVSLGVLGGLGAMLAATGIFGMASYSVSKRLRELGIRIALGAQRKEVLQAALGRATILLLSGSVAGLLLGLAATKVLSFIVYQATPRDPLVLAGVIFAMLMLGLIATWIPAQRALSADPLALLREQ